jgi:hypothetical protein
MFTQAMKLTPDINPLTEKPWIGREKDSAKEYKKSAPENGDRAIANSLKFLKEKFSPSLFVYGLDSNTAADYFPKANNAPRLHPKRLRQFTTAGWICDQTDKSFTIVDHHLDPASMNKNAVPPLSYILDPQVQMKYDYVFVKSNGGHALSIESQALGPTPDQFALIPSDHRPVYAKIELKATWSSTAWFIFRFFYNKIMFLLGR